MVMQFNDNELRELTAIKYAADVRDICNPLFLNTPITYFSTSRRYPTGHYTTFMSDPDWANLYYGDGYLQANMDAETMDFLSSDYILWSVSNIFNKCTKMQELYHQCKAAGYGKGITLIERNSDYLQLYYFAMSHLVPNADEYLLKNIIVFKRFILWYKEKVHENFELLKAQETRYHTNLPEIILPTEINNVKLKPDFCIKKFYLGYPFTDNVFFTKREFECLKMLALGKTAKEIAKIFNISFRTVETHIEHIKKKSGCKELRDLKYMLAFNKYIKLS